MPGRSTVVLLAALLSVESESPRSFGDVARIAREHDLGPKVALAQILEQPHAYGIGSLAGLKGEITILDGKVWLAYPPATPADLPKMVTVPAGTEKAAFLVAAHVDPGDWKKVRLPERLSSADLDERLAGLALANGLAGRSFAFRVDGRFETITLAIVDGRRLPAGPGTKASLQAAKAFENVANIPGTLVGFFSPAPTSPFTHPGTQAHAHAIIPDQPATGHAELFTLAPGAVLWLQMGRADRGRP